MTYAPTGMVHLAAAFGAVALGAIVVLRPKSGRTHRRLGYAYAVALFTTNVNLLMLYRLTGSFNLLHVFALASLASLIAGLLPAIRRRPANEWLELHFRFMSGSYIGLLAALVAETATRFIMPLLQAKGIATFGSFWTIVAVATVAVFGVGFWLMNTAGVKAFNRLRQR